MTSKLVAAWIEPETMKELLKLKQHERETSEDVISRLIEEHKKR